MKDLKALCAIGGIVLLESIALMKGIVAIGGIVVLESIALMKGIDGTILTMVVATLAGLGGYYVRGQIDDILLRAKESYR